jgi:general secretion pathway protein G
MFWHHDKRQGSQRRSRGFTLIEIMVVIVIIGLLAGVLAVNVRAHMTRANISAAKLELAKIHDHLEIYKQQTGKYPDPASGLTALLQPMADTGEPLLAEADLEDPWRNPYEYVVPGPQNQPYELLCLGADGREGGTGANQDISHLQLE